MKNRAGWFISFYLILSSFIFFEMIFTIMVWQNHELKMVYEKGFEILSGTPVTFNPSNLFCVFYLPLVGLGLSCCSLLITVATINFLLRKSPQLNFCFILFCFIFFVIGFFLNFAGQLFYNQWNNISVQIKINDSAGTIVAGNWLYKNWLSSSTIWSIFGIYFAFIIGCVILMIKLYFINIQTYHFYRQREVIEEIEPELKYPLPSSMEFDPNETQTITIFLDDDNGKKTAKK